MLGRGQDSPQALGCTSGEVDAAVSSLGTLVHKPAAQAGSSQFARQVDSYYQLLEAEELDSWPVVTETRRLGSGSWQAEIQVDTAEGTG